MAVLADVTGVDMSRALADCIGTVMTADAVAGYVYVVEVRGDPCRRHVAIVTGVATLNMRRVLAGGHGAVVAGSARADDLQMVDRVGGRPDQVVMAILAEVGRIDVSGTLARCLDTVMAARTVVDDIGVIEVGRNPRVGRMAVVTIVAAADMCRVLACRDGAVVA